MMPRGPLEGARGVKAAAGEEGTQKTYIFDAHWIAFGAFLVPLMPKWAPFWAPLDFEGVSNENNSIQNQDEVWKTYDQDHCQEKHQFLKDFRYQNKRLKKLEKMFSQYTRCILRDFAGSRSSMKNEHPNVTTNPLKLTPWAPFGEIVEIGSGFWKTLHFLFCITFSIDPNIEKRRMQKIRKWSESDAKGGESALPDSCRSTRGRLTGP